MYLSRPNYYQLMLKQIYRFLSPKFQNVFLDYPVQFVPRYGHGTPPHRELYDIVNQNREDYKQWINKSLQHIDKLAEIKVATEEKDSTKPVWNNGFLPGLDIIAIYTMLAELKPSKYVEIGSGNSTKVAYKAKSELGLATEITSIDPMPRAEIDKLADKVIRKPFENIDFSFIDNLVEGDILFVDNSHRILPNSDAMVFFMEILPRLKKGVVVHIHDIYIPYDYPQFMCDRAYNEQYGLAFYLLANPQKYRTIFPNYFVSEDKELAAMLNPFWQKDNLKTVERHGGSYWLQVAE
jgi:hypothetical protein